MFWPRTSAPSIGFIRTASVLLCKTAQRETRMANKSHFPKWLFFWSALVWFSWTGQSWNLWALVLFMTTSIYLLCMPTSQTLWAAFSNLMCLCGDNDITLKGNPRTFLDCHCLRKPGFNGSLNTCWLSEGAIEMPGVSIQGIQGIAGTLSDRGRTQPTGISKTKNCLGNSWIPLF